MQNSKKFLQVFSCEPETVLADSLYGSDDNIEAAAKLGVEVIAPAMGSIVLSGFSIFFDIDFVILDSIFPGGQGSAVGGE